MNLFRKALGFYSEQFNEIDRKMKLDGGELPFRGFFSFIFYSGVMGGLVGIFVGLIEGSLGILISNLCLTIMAMLGPMCLNKGINPKK